MLSVLIVSISVSSEPSSSLCYLDHFKNPGLID